MGIVGTSNFKYNEQTGVGIIKPKALRKYEPNWII
tara:strand:+ start:844 stop:948 length:105 start_codon:yes stop_codon:yes gene_type:complete